MHRPLLYPLIALTAGILAGDLIDAPLFLLLSLMLPVLLLLLISVRHHWNMAACFGIICLMVIIGVFNIQKQRYFSLSNQHIIHQAEQGKLTIEGIVMTCEPIAPDRNALIVRGQRMIKNNSYSPVTGNIRLVIPSDVVFQYADFIRFHSSIKKIQGFHNPGGFQYERYLNRQGIFVSGFVANQAGIVLIRHNAAGRIQFWIDAFRLRLKRLIDENAPTPQKEILQAMTIGQSKSIPQDVRDYFAQTGTSHILAISGLHIGMVAAAGYFLCQLLLKSSEYLMLRFNIIKMAAAFAFLPVLVYALVAGMGTTVLRATLMALAFLSALLIGKKRDLYNILFGAALIILIVSPQSLFEISFQLSFSAVFAILYIVPKFSGLTLSSLSSAPHGLQTSIRQLYLFLLVSTAATLGTLPIIVFYFNRVSVVTLLANLIAVPLLGMLTLMLVLAFIFTAVFSPWIAGLIIKAASFFTGIAVLIIGWLASLPWSSFTLTRPNFAEMILFYFILYLIIEWLTPDGEKRKKKFLAQHPVFLKAALITCLLIAAGNGFYLYAKDKYSTHLKATAIDVGQGSSTLIQFPRGINMLIDGGGFPHGSLDMGRAVIAPLLYAKRIRKIDVVVLSHPHPDHLQGLIYIMKNFDVREVWCTGLKADDDLYRLWEKAISGENIKIRYLSAQSPPEIISDVKIQCLWPLQPIAQYNQNASYDETNDSSLVMKFIYGKKSMLLTGDISVQVETSLIASGKDLKSDLLLVPHHGSIHSSSIEFIRAVHAPCAIISAGKNNVFRHPHPVILDRYTSAGTEIFRTDQDGAINILSDGDTLKIFPWLKRPSNQCRQP